MLKKPHESRPTVGQVLKKIMAINPDLSSQQMIAIMKESVEVRGGYFQDGFARQDIIDEAKACALTRSTLPGKSF